MSCTGSRSISYGTTVVVYLYVRALSTLIRGASKNSEKVTWPSDEQAVRGNVLSIINLYTTQSGSPNLFDFGHFQNYIVQWKCTL